MSNTIAEPSPLDPTASCHPNEPIFPLVGHDPDAPAAVRFWADTRRTRITRLINDLPPGTMMTDDMKEDLRRCTEADFIANDMESWLKGKDADEKIKGGRLRHGNDERPDADESTTEIREKLAKAVTNLREAAYYASEAKSLFETFNDVTDDEITELGNAIAIINSMAEHRALKRPIPQKENEELPTASA